MRERHQRVMALNGTAASRDGVERTQEVNDEAGHAHELLLALAAMVVSSVVSSDGSSPLEAGGRRRATYSTSLVGVPTAADILSVVWGGIRLSGESVDGDDGWKW
jgi:hypothetical protein